MEKGIVIITGVTKGLGQAMTREFAKKGWKIAGCGRSVDSIQQLQEEYGPEHIFSVVDINNDLLVKKWSKEILEKIGTPDILINNAALINDPNPIWKISSSEFTSIISTNVIGTFNILQCFIPLMIKKGNGIMINVTSEWGRKAEKMFSPYCASKFAIEGLTQSIAKELPEGLAIISLNPGGGINTDMLKKAYPQYAMNYPTAEQRAKVMISYILNLSAKDNGKSLTVSS